MSCLLHVLRGETGQPTASLSEWEQAFDLAETESVRPYFCAQLRRCDATLPPPVGDLLARAEQQTAVASFWWTSELRGILRAFAQARLPVIPIKGPMFADRVYGGPHLRMSRDIDLLVRHSDLAAAREYLVEIGFTSSIVPDDYHQCWIRGTTCVELHHNVENPLAFRFDLAGAWKRATPREFLGQPVLQLAPVDELILICLHGVRHRFEQLSHVLDVALALRQLSPHVPEGAYRKEHSGDLRRVFLVATSMAERLDDTCLRDPAVLRLDTGTSTPRRAEQLRTLCDTIWSSTLNQQRVRLDWETQHRFYLEIEATSIARLLRRIRHGLILLTRLIQPDYDYASRFGVRSPALVWLMRPFRLLGRPRTPAARLGA